MIVLFQILFTLFSLLAITSVVRRKQAGELSMRGAAFWTLFWLCADVAVFWPGETVRIANFFGIGRGTDFILYVSLAVIFFVLFRLHVKIEKMNRDVTKVVRRNAIEDTKK